MFVEKKMTRPSLWNHLQFLEFAVLRPYEILLAMKVFAHCSIRNLHELIPNNQQRITHHEQPTTNNQQQPTTNNNQQQPTTNNNQQPTTTNNNQQQPTTNNQQPTTHNESRGFGRDVSPFHLVNQVHLCPRNIERTLRWPARFTFHLSFRAITLLKFWILARDGSLPLRIGFLMEPSRINLDFFFPDGCMAQRSRCPGRRPSGSAN